MLLKRVLVPAASFEIACGILLALPYASAPAGGDPAPPQAEISNGVIHAVLSLPDQKNGYYRGTRFDWSGVINSLSANAHNYYGPWFNKTDPSVIDFVFRGPDIVAGPCSAISGPVEEFVSGEKALGYDDAKPGGTFIKIGVGVLRRPDAQNYNPYRLYDIVDAGHWTVRRGPASIEFTQELRDPASGYAYRYTKTVRLVPNKPEMMLEHELQNTGRRAIETNVYDHNFLVLDGATTGPDFQITVPYKLAAKAEDHTDARFFEVAESTFRYLRPLTGRDTVAADFSGFGKAPSDYRITIENKAAGAGMTIAGDRPLASEHLWSIRSVIAVEPFIEMNIEPGKAFRWRYTYSYYALPNSSK